MTPAAHGASGLFQHLVHVGPRRLPRRRASEQHAGQSTRRQRKQQHRNVQAHVGFGWQRERRHQRHDAVQHQRREPDAEDAADRGERHALREHLTEQPGADCPHRGADRQLPLPRRPARQQQVRDVRAGDEQDEPHGAEQQPQRGLRLLAQEVVLQRLDARRPTFVRRRERFRQATRHHFHVGVGLRQRDARLEPPHHEQPVEIVVDLFRLERERHVEARLHPIGLPRRKDADDGVRLGVDADLTADDAAIGAEPLLPDLVREDDDLIAADLPLLGTEVAPQREWRTCHRQVAGGRHPRRDLLRPIRRGKVNAAAGPGDEALERRALPFPLQEGAGRADVAVALDPRPDHDELIGMRIRQRRQQRRVNDAEDRCGRPDPEGQREDRHRGKPGIPAEQPQAESNVTQKVGHRPSSFVLRPLVRWPGPNEQPAFRQSRAEFGKK